jgi:hypothetical protein|tara:strand:+ start:722 stop:946 length:225 start_codon:yes stop_codon:yes gene_type:complete
MMFEHGKITHEYGLSYARNIPYHTLKQMEQSVANVQKLFKKKLDIFDTMYYLNIISYGELQKSYKSQHLIVDTR